MTLCPSTSRSPRIAAGVPSAGSPIATTAAAAMPTAPSRHGRLKLSLMTTPTLAPVCAANSRRRPAALASGSTSSRSAASSSP